MEAGNGEQNGTVGKKGLSVVLVLGEVMVLGFYVTMLAMLVMGETRDGGGGGLVVVVVAAGA